MVPGCRNLEIRLATLELIFVKFPSILKPVAVIYVALDIKVFLYQVWRFFNHFPGRYNHFCKLVDFARFSGRRQSRTVGIGVCVLASKKKN